MVKLRYEGGRENKGSFLFSKASLEQALFENQQIQRATNVARLSLARVLGRTADLDFDISGTLTWNPVEPNPEFKKWVSQTPDHRQAEAQWQVAEADSLIARGDFFPEISLQGSYSKVGSNFPPDTKRWSVGVSIAFPFFPGGQNIFNYQSANAEAHRADLLKTNADNVILAKLQQTHAALLDAMGLQKVAKEFVEASEARAIVSRGKYQTGLMSFEDWDLIETDLINRQKTELQSRRDVVLAEAAFEQAQGKSVLQ
jgi:outer membrane protein TolC